MPPIGHMDWIGFGSAFTSSLWIGLDWVIELMDWIGLDLENWTHVQLCSGHESDSCKQRYSKYLDLYIYLYLFNLM